MHGVFKPIQAMKTVVLDRKQTLTSRVGACSGNALSGTPCTPGKVGTQRPFCMLCIHCPKCQDSQHTVSCELCAVCQVCSLYGRGK
jgi:hypothetical protein